MVFIVGIVSKETDVPVHKGYALYFLCLGFIGYVWYIVWSILSGLVYRYTRTESLTESSYLACLTFAKTAFLRSFSF